MDVLKAVLEAEARIRPYIRETLLAHSAHYSATSGAEVYFKCENLQHTGSFKVRGATSKLLAITEAERARGVVTASTGNHGAATAYALRQLGAHGIVYIPENAEPTKLANIERLGATIRRHGQDGVESEREARAFAAAEGLCYISPYNDPDVVAGQGTVGLEIERQLGNVDTVYVALGGGGLLGGIAGYLKARQPGVRIVGCSPENSQVMIRSVQAGRVLELPSLPTLSDGTAGGVEADAMTLPLCRDFVDEYVTVSEEEIGASLREFMQTEHMLIEGAAAVAIAAFRRTSERCAGRKVAIVLCGANIGLGTLRNVLAPA